MIRPVIIGDQISFWFNAPPHVGLRPAILIDRDGVINCRNPRGYVTDWTEFKFVPGIKIMLKRLSALLVPMIVVSNQAGVSKGLVDRSKLEYITARFVASLAAAGARIDAVYYCPHTTEQNCRCRKPRSGLLEQAARDWRIDLPTSIMIGDSLTDLQAARRVGCKAILFRPRRCSSQGMIRTRSFAMGHTVDVVPYVQELLQCH